MQTSRKMQIRMMSGVLLGSGGGLMVEGCEGLAIVGRHLQLGNGGTLTPFIPLSRQRRIFNP